AYPRQGAQAIQDSLDRVFAMFPILGERRQQKAGTLSGGQQQMLAIGRGLMLSPRLLMLDEPSLGIAPLVVRTIFDAIKKINDDGTTILLVDQNVRESLALAEQAFVIQSGRIVLHGQGSELLRSDLVQRVLLGLSDKTSA
ncbi:MAG: ATP-binding cassette domain-containing protein, partial [Planctomycetales bacterium]|nr:ATP-binding cassette domain-containing protein [Planctomycetales bacterium]